MIGKVPRAGTGFRGVVNYLMRGKRGASLDPNRVAWAETRNLLVDEPDLAPKIMRLTAERSARCERPVYHLVVSWRSDENPTAELMRQVGDATLADLDLAEHQAIYIAHHDTEHQHLHMVVNRVHPERHTAWHRSNDWPKIERSLRRQSEAMGMPYVPGRHNDPEKFVDRGKNARSSEYRRAERLGTVQDLPRRWTREQIAARRPRLADTFDKARSWDDLARSLSADGLTVARKGQGIVVGDATGTMKLSDLRRDIRLNTLEFKFEESFDTYAQRLREIDKEEEKARNDRELRVAMRLAQQSEEAGAAAQDAALQPAKQPSRVKPEEPLPEPKHALAQAHAEADLAYALHRAGLVSKAQLERSVNQLDRMSDEALRAKGFQERLARDLLDTLKSEPARTPAKKLKKSKRKDRGRGM